MRNLWVLLGVVVFSALLVPVIALRYSYNTLTLGFSGVGFVILIACALFLWFYRMRMMHAGRVMLVNSALGVGLALGLLWVVEISINNLLAPPLPWRDIIDDIFWALIALGTLSFVIVCAYRTGHIPSGIQSGIWTGFVSGAVACGTALTLIVLGMSLILKDPLNLAEWSVRQGESSATMAAFFAYETFAGAFLHLIVLGLGMGILLGLIGGMIGWFIKTAARFTTRVTGTNS